MSKLKMVLKAKGCRKLITQIGSCSLDLSFVKSDKEMNIEMYTYKDSILEDIKRADLVIGHAGAGTTLDVLRNDKVLLVVVNTRLMNNHQSELADKLSEDGFVYQCTPETLLDCLLLMRKSNIKPFPRANTNAFSDFLDNELF
ncbi:UDP-N-acetylglucosamine transferase subunit ALG13-like protein [Leptotrombidium deliense]|uniref:UDP-N-acetylglucosamine transferase subunit ALG13 n=1 Tax=Leptotrombidium deliense TaxID=299467 RepID=A0A443SQP3_9ACAR|nr:UDP-N-acetylglucosamine transferase subunit ALG13-like protein [Leptotrombidium deliense]